MPDRWYKVENASKADAADYKITDDMSEKCVALIRLTVKGTFCIPCLSNPCDSSCSLSLARGKNFIMYLSI